ncbi:UNVERIFIED_CONTAM: hypothetical protein K2H54_026561 [Gekko kuhli]
MAKPDVMLGVHDYSTVQGWHVGPRTYLQGWRDPQQGEVMAARPGADGATFQAAVTPGAAREMEGREGKAGETQRGSGEEAASRKADAERSPVEQQSLYPHLLSKEKLAQTMIQADVASLLKTAAAAPLKAARRGRRRRRGQARGGVSRREVGNCARLERSCTSGHLGPALASADECLQKLIKFGATRRL